MSPVGQYCIITPPFPTLSLIMKYLFLMCLVRLEHKNLPFVAINIVDLLSCIRIFFLISQECAISQETKDLLHKAGAIRTMVAAARRTLPKATKQTQVAVAAVLLRSMARRTKESSSHRRSVLGGNGNAICQRSIGTDRRRR